jgi:hypothetical protein
MENKIMKNLTLFISIFLTLYMTLFSYKKDIVPTAKLTNIVLSDNVNIVNNKLFDEKT